MLRIIAIVYLFGLSMACLINLWLWTFVIRAYKLIKEEEKLIKNTHISI